MPILGKSSMATAKQLARAREVTENTLFASQLNVFFYSVKLVERSSRLENFKSS